MMSCKRLLFPFALILLLISGASATDTVHRYRRQYELIQVPDPCDFGSELRLTTCIWQIPDNDSSTSGKIRWRPGTGASSYWIGGPRTDHTDGDREGGYAFYETSEVAMVPSSSKFRPQQNRQRLQSPVYNHTGPSGLCLSFYYNVAGLSAKGLRVVLRNWRGAETVLWESRDANDGTWYLGEVAYSYGEKHSVIFEAVAHDQSHRKLSYR